VTTTMACAAVLALAVLAAHRLRAWRIRRDAERAWADACARYPWRVAAVLDGGPLLLMFGDDVLRLWWEDEGRALYPEIAAMEGQRR